MISGFGSSPGRRFQLETAGSDESRGDFEDVPGVHSNKRFEIRFNVGMVSIIS
jgi:hypothetical protein